MHGSLFALDLPRSRLDVVGVVARPVPVGVLAGVALAGVRVGGVRDSAVAHVRRPVRRVLAVLHHRPAAVRRARAVAAVRLLHLPRGRRRRGAAHAAANAAGRQRHVQVEVGQRGGPSEAGGGQADAAAEAAAAQAAHAARSDAPGAEGRRVVHVEAVAALHVAPVGGGVAVGAGVARAGAGVTRHVSSSWRVGDRLGNALGCGRMSLLE